MCTIYSFNEWSGEAKYAWIHRFYLDLILNNDGISFIFMSDADPCNDMVIKSFDLDFIISSIDAAFVNGSGRAFVHFRSATRDDITLATTHAFVDPYSGKLIMHNGILRSKLTDDYVVDSFGLNRLCDLGGPVEEIVEDLLRAGENYVNMFIIDLNRRYWTVIKLTETGKMHTNSNKTLFSSMPVAELGVIHPVDAGFAKDFEADYLGESSYG